MGEGHGFVEQASPDADAPGGWRNHEPRDDGNMSWPEASELVRPSEGGVSIGVVNCHVAHDSSLIIGHPAGLFGRSDDEGPAIPWPPRRVAIMLVSVLRQLEARVNVVVRPSAEDNRVAGEHPSHGFIVVGRSTAPHPDMTQPFHRQLRPDPTCPRTSWCTLGVQLAPNAGLRRRRGDCHGATMGAVRSNADHIDERMVRDALALAWRLEATGLRYAAVGGGAFHWTAECAGAGLRFLTCDDLDNKQWIGFGRDRDVVFENLTSAYRAAMSLRSAGNLFVVAPTPTTTGSPTWRLDEQHSLAVFEFVDGRQGQWGEPLARRHHHELVEALVALHRATPIVSGLRRRVLEVPGRDELDDALLHLDQPWSGGPLSEAVREELSRGSDAVRALFDELDNLTRALDHERPLVVTHGEPHPGNVIYTATGPAFIDWDTVALAPPERDLWMLAEIDSGLLATYERATGTSVDSRALRAWPLVWALSDLAAFTALLRGAHEEHTDTKRSLVALRQIITGSEPKPYG